MFPDGTVQKLLPSGDRSIEFPTGQREIHTRDFKVCSSRHNEIGLREGGGTTMLSSPKKLANSAWAVFLNE